MATANIVISQPANAIPVGVAGRARQDLLLQSAVVLTNANDDGVVSWRWTMVSKPQGSTATLSSLSTPSTQFVPDVQGTYLIQLSLNGAAAGETQQRIAAVLDEAGIRYPAPGETGPMANYDVGGDENEEGWAPAVEMALRAAKSTSGFPEGTQNAIAGSPSEYIYTGGLWWPTAIDQIASTDWLDYQGGNIGPAPTIVSISFQSMFSVGGSVSINLLNIELDTTACSAGDRWAPIVFTTAGALLILTRVIMI
jgi:hypothetical protein